MSLLGSVMNPPIPYIGSIPGGKLTPGFQIVIQGVAPSHSEGFSFNLAYGSAVGDPRSDTALHFNPRFTQNCVVRNSFKNNNWAGEERQNGMPFTKHTPFEITISADVNCYKIYVNKRHFCDFQHRLPINGVNTFTCEGTVNISSVQFIAPNMPSMPAPPPYMNYPAQPPMPLINPAMPLTTMVPNGLHPGKMIYISATPVGNDRFTINLQEGSYPNCDIGMHFDVRFNCGSDCNQIIRNSLSRGAWGQEERSIPYFPFAGNMPFEMIILCENGCFKVAVNNQHFVEYRHRMTPFTRFNTLTVTGNLTIQQVRFQ